MNDFIGSKEGAGVYQWLLSLMPAHRRYVEAFGGRGVLVRRKVPAREDVVIELSARVVSRFWSEVPGHVRLIHSSAFDVLPHMSLEASDLVYADPPYLGSVRGGRVYYDCEVLEESEHKRLCELLKSLRCMVMLSGYWSELYASMLPGWRHSSKWTVTRGGRRVQEFCWMNFPEPVFYHQVCHTGEDYTDRQRIKRKIERWRCRFLSMPAAERQAVYEGLQDCL